MAVGKRVPAFNPIIPVCETEDTEKTYIDTETVLLHDFSSL